MEDHYHQGRNHSWHACEHPFRAGLFGCVTLTRSPNKATAQPVLSHLRRCFPLSHFKVPMCFKTLTHAQTHTHSRTCTFTCTHICQRVRVHTHTHAHTHTRTHTHTVCTSARAHTHTNMHTYTHTHMPILPVRVIFIMIEKAIKMHTSIADGRGCCSSNLHA